MRWTSNGHPLNGAHRARSPPLHSGGALTGCARHTGGGKSRTICSPRVAQVSAPLRCVMDATLPESVASTQQSRLSGEKKGADLSQPPRSSVTTIQGGIRPFLWGAWSVHVVGRIPGRTAFENTFRDSAPLGDLTVVGAHPVHGDGGEASFLAIAGK